MNTKSRLLCSAVCLFVAADAAVATPPTPVAIPTIPSYATAAVGTMYASTCPVIVNSSVSTSTFCPNATDPNSTARRTYPANTLTPGKGFALDGGGVFTVPTGNLLSADITLKVGASTIVAVTTPTAPVGTNAGIAFHADCMVMSTTTMTCTGYFMFDVLGTTPVIVPFNSITAKTFDPTVPNLVDVLGDWNGTTTTQSTTVQSAILTARN